jgi:hypothetical protein
MSGDYLIKEINEYAKLLKKASRWENSELSIAPVETRNSENRGIFYIYEFYCMIRIVDDLCSNYEMVFVTGEDEFEYKFPQASSNKKGKPKFTFLKDGEHIFDIYGGVHVKGEHECEEDHPDISFLKPNSPDDADATWLIMIMDAKFVSDFHKLSKSEPSVFESIVRRFKLHDAPRIEIKFSLLNGIEGNSLLTNGIFHADKTKGLDKRLKDNFIKEVHKFYPNFDFEIAG